MLSIRKSLNYFLHKKFLQINKIQLIKKFETSQHKISINQNLKLQTNFINKNSLLNKTLTMTQNLKSTEIKYLEEPEKSDNDKKIYKNLILPNGMQCLLISDTSPMPVSDTSSAETSSAESESESGDSSSDSDGRAISTSSGSTSSSSSSEEGDEKMAACCLQINVGSFTEPRKYQGLAHLLEHMIFMGSEKYPGENAYDAHIKKCGGFANANTEDENTLFYFEVPNEHLDSTMDYFSALFISPIMTKDAITRERRAVESEFQETKLDDDVRRDQILATLGKKDYPHNAFTWGNLKSLEENIDDQELTNVLHEFRKRHYSAHRMYLCVQARLPIDEIEKLVVNHFSNIPNNNLPGIDLKQYDYREAFTQDFFKYVYFMKPIQKINRVEFTWVLPPMKENFKCKPDEFFSYLIGYEGAGSLTGYLRKRLWVLELLSGNDESSTFDSNGIYYLFTLCIVLTDEGFRHLDEVIEATFAYIKLFTKIEPLESIYKELQHIEANNFRFASEQPAFDNVQNLVGNIKLYPSKHVLNGNELYFEYDREQIQQVIDNLNQFKFNLMITSNLEYEGKIYNKKEEWFETDYGTIEMPQKWRDMWENSKPIAELFLPLPNEFIPKDFHIFWEENGKPEISHAPKKILQTELFELWCKEDDKFLLPEAYMYFDFISPLPRQSAKNAVMCGFLKEFIEFFLAEELYPATIAGLNYSLNFTERGLLLKVYGYNDKLVLLVNTITKALVTMSEKINENQLEIFKTQEKKGFFNELIKPKYLNRDLRLAVVENIRWPMTKKLEVISSITLNDMHEFCNAFRNELYVKALMQGNLTKEIAHNVMNAVFTTLNSKPIKNTRYIENRTCQIPKGSHYLRCRNLNKNDTNTVVCNFYQMGPCSVEMESQLDLLFMFVDEPMFDTLRTKENLGYNVSTSTRWNYGISAYTITVHSQEMSHTATHVEKRIESFHKSIVKILEDVSVEEFEKVRDSQIKLKQITDISLSVEINRNWSEITTDDYMFDRRRREIEVLRTITKQNMIDFWNENLRNNFRKLSVQVIGSKTPVNVATEEKKIKTKNVNSNANANKMVDDKIVDNATLAAAAAAATVASATTTETNDADAAAEDSDDDNEMLYNLFGDKMKLQLVAAEDRSQMAIIDINDFKKNLYVYPVTKTKLNGIKSEDNSNLM